MPRRTPALSLIVVAGLVAATPAAAETPCRPQGVPRAEPNDNHVAAGTLREGVLTVRLVARETAWYPDGPHGCALVVRAFAEEGAQARIPGPLMRVPAGTEIRARVRNALTTPIWLRGLQDRAGGTLDSTELAPGATREFRFRATAPGAWYYWGAARSAPSGGQTSANVPVSDENGQLVGALVVDAPNGARGDRVFVMTRWSAAGRPGTGAFQVNAINGRSWPNTERLTYTAGDSVRWHVINASDDLHMMHLHGFYYHVDHRGDAAHDSVLAGGGRVSVVTVATRRGEWMTVSWSPDRPGNWLFHCHFLAHMSADQRLTEQHTAHAAAPAAAQHASHAMDDMAGLVLGLTVRPRGVTTTLGARDDRPRRVLHVYADRRERVFGERPGYGFVVREGAPPAPDSIRIPGAPIVLTRGEPASLVVHNRAGQGLAVHWHGIELESYYDGVAGWSGGGRRVAPSIAPGDTFVARLTPPRAGTFMYHVHSERGEELASGLYAPLLVVERGATFDPRTDRVLMIATAGPGADAQPPFVNGSASPDTLVFEAGTTYRLRLIDIASNDAHTLALRGPDGALATWRLLARDGRDVSDDESTPRPARENVAAGTTRDFAFTPATPGLYEFSALRILSGVPPGRPTIVPIRVK